MRFLPCSLVLILSGCAGLLVHQDDPAPIIAAKTVWRTVLGVSTLGLSEMHMSVLRDAANADALADQRLQDYEWHLTYLVNNGALTQPEAETLYQKYAALVWQETLDVTGGAGGQYSSSGYGLSGYGLGTGSPWNGLYPASRFARTSTAFGQNPADISNWNSHNNFAGISAMARSRANTARWSRFSYGSRGSFFRGSGSKGSGRRGGRR